MNVSTFFLDLRSAYQAELEDLATDSEGHDVLRKRLAEKRKALGFLLQMMESSPEMVAVVLHQAFRFTVPSQMEHLVAQDADDVPAWDSLSAGIEVAAWAQDMVQTILQQPAGDWFLTIAAALEYMHHKPAGVSERVPLGDAEEDEDEVRHDRHDDSHTEDQDDDEADARAREEAGNDWLAEQGFDRKD